MLRLFTPPPLTFRERRELIKRKWDQYGYGKTSRPNKQAADIAERVNSLMIAFN